MVPATRSSLRLTAIVSAALYARLGMWPWVVGVTCLIIGYVYSWRLIRLKSIPVADLISHGLMLAGLQFLAAYFTFGPGPAWRWMFPLTFIVAISLYGQLFNELRDFEGDVIAGVTHTASLLGGRVAHILMMTLLMRSLSATGRCCARRVCFRSISL